MNRNYIIRSCTFEAPNSNITIVEVEGKSAPKKVGHSYYFTTPSGKTRINYPSSYGWPMKYHHSTLKIVVGKDWQPKIPKGMTLHIYKGVCVLIRNSDKFDFHFHASDFKRSDFCTWARRQMAHNYKKRLETRRLERVDKHFQKIFNKEAPKCHILLEDSRKAGNCVAGSLEFAKQMGISKVESWFTSLPAIKLINSKNERALAAVRQAFARETTISI